MIPPAPGRSIHKDIDGRQWGLSLHSSISLSWFEDTTGNPVIIEDNGTPEGIMYYADWDNEQQKFVKKELFSMASRKDALKEKKYRLPTTEEVQYYDRHVMYGDYWRPTPIVEPATDKEDSANKDSGAEDSAKHQPAESSLVLPITTQSNYDRPLHPKDRAALYAAPAAGSIKRPVLAIYVRFTDTTEESIPDSYILNFLTNTSEFGTFAHYYHTNLKGAVEFPVVNNKVYTVVLPASAKRQYGKNHDDFFKENVIIATLNQVIDTGEVDFTTDFGPYVDDDIDLSASQSGITIGKKAIDPANVTPLLILHGQEAAAGASGTKGAACNVWGHARTRSVYGALIGIPPGSKKFENIGSSFMPKQWDYYLHAYGCFGAFQGSDSHNFTVGILAHELGHAMFDFVDLYDISTPTSSTDTEDNISGAGIWSVMAQNWTYTNEPGFTQSGAVPPNVDGYHIWRFNHRFGNPVATDGQHTITDTFTPNVVLVKNSEQEVFVLQPRCYTGYDACIPVWFKQINGDTATPEPGVLIQHVNSSINHGNRGITVSGYAEGMIATVMEAHGGTQNLRADRSTATGLANYNFGDKGDLFGPYGKTSFGDSTDPDNSLYLTSGKAGFSITDIAVDATTCGATYTITFNGNNPDLQDWTGLPDDPLRPDAEQQPDPDPDPDPEPDPEPEPSKDVDCVGRPRIWRFRNKRWDTPTQPVTW